jgi:hypothetical protein
MFRNYLILFALLFSSYAYTQSGGDNTFDFLNLPNSARIAALGGMQISIFDDELNFVNNNPSLLNGSMSNQLALNYINYLDDINFGSVMYARTIKGYGNFALGVNYFDYGKFTYANELGEKGGNFSASDYTINASYSRPILDSLFHVGGTLKAIGSDYESYNSFGLAIDAGITYFNQNRLFSAALVIKSLGFQLNTYYSTTGQEPLPFEIQLGISQKLKYAPFRLSVLFQHLETPDLRYKTEQDLKDEIDPITGEKKKEDKLANFGDNVMRHVIFGLEFLPTKNFHIDIGYNYKRRQELKISDKPGFSGFSWGFGLKLYKFRISYGRASYHLAGVSNHFTINVNLAEFVK